jgi:putative ABC transport system permease protein
MHKPAQLPLGDLARRRFASVRLPLVLRIALREFRGGFRGFAVFLFSIALGVGAITGVGSAASALKQGLALQGRAILGGDLSFDTAQRELGRPEQDYLASQGRLTAVALMRAMARADGGDTALAEIKAVDSGYPLADGPQLNPPLPLGETLAGHGGTYGIAADPLLLQKLGLKTGSKLSIGEARFEVRAKLVSEPDRLASGLRFGLPILISQDGLRATGLLQPGALIKWQYRLRLNGAYPSDEQIAAFGEEARRRFPAAGWDIRTRTKISPQFTKTIDRFTEFLTLTVLTALIVGGVGVANAVHAFVERKRETVATLKALGATGVQIFAIMLTQAMFVAGAGAVLGAAVGAALPYLAVSFLGPLLPFPLAPAIYSAAIGKGLIFGLLTALSFSAGPLGRAHEVPVQALFRSEVERIRGLPRLPYVLLATGSGLCLIEAVLVFAADRGVALIYCGAAFAALLLLRAVAFVIMAAAKRLPHARNIALRLAIGNLHRPRAPTTAVVLSLGLGLALVAALAQIGGNIRAELHHSAPARTPSFFFLDIPQTKGREFAEFLQQQMPDGRVEMVPMLRGRIVRLNGAEAATARSKPAVAWVLEGDRGITFSEGVPEGSTVAAGSWWPRGYSGPPLVSMESEAAEGLGLKIGDDIAVNVLGREIAAKLASTRRVNWRTYGINFVLVFSPNTFAGAPYGELATLTLPGRADAAREAALIRKTAAAFPQVTSIRVRDALDAADALIGRLAFAIRCASSIALLASALVLSGALASGQHARAHDAVVLKVLGATRGLLLRAYLYEFGIVSLCAALAGLAAGSAAAFAAVSGVMDLDFLWLWPEAIITAGGSACTAIVLGLSRIWHILGQRPAPYLREL